MAYWNGTSWVLETVAAPSRRQTPIGRVLGAATEAALIVVLAFGLLAGTTFAAAGGKGGEGGKPAAGTIQYYVLDGTDAVANHTERVAFNVTATATDRPFVGVRCWQGTAWVLDGYTGYFDTYMFEPWVSLDSNYWTPGQAASCTARLFYYDKRGNQKVLATVDFTALP